METSFGAWLQARMTEVGATQAQVAAAIGVRQQTISKYINGAEKPRPDRIEPLAAVLEVSVFDVLDALPQAISLPEEPGDREAQLRRLRHIEEEARRLRRQLGDEAP